MAFAGFHQGRTLAWVGPLTSEGAPDLADPDRHEVPVVEITADVAAAHAALTGVRHGTYFSFGDARPHDVNPNRCWRCDAARGETDVGLCARCHTALTNAT